MTNPKPLSKGLLRVLNAVHKGVYCGEHDMPSAQAAIRKGLVTFSAAELAYSLTQKGIAAQQSGAHQ